jgi:hypothetical protein
VQSKLWTKPGGYQFNKGTNRVWGIVQYFDSRSQNIDLTVDTNLTTDPLTLSAPTVTMNWTTASGAPMNWTTQTGNPMTWTTAATGIRVFDPIACGQQGVLTGMTAFTVAADLAIISLMIQAEITAYRG